MEVWACHTVTGDRRAVLPVDGAPWSVGLDAVGSVQATVNLAGMSPTRGREMYARLRPWTYSLAAVADGRVIEAGPIITHPADDGQGRVRVQAAGMWALLERRLVPDLALSGLTLGSIVRRLLVEAMSGAGRSLPIVLPAESDGSAQRTYRASDLASTWQRVSELSQVIGGPDVALEPRVRADGLGVEWVLRTGAPLLSQVGPDWLLDPSGQVSGASVSIDGSGMATSVTAVGAVPEGDEWPIRETVAVSPGDGPALERVIQHTSVTIPATLVSHATAEVSRASAPWSSWSVSAIPSSRFPVGQVRCGDWARVIVPESSLTLPPGPVRGRIVSMSGGLSGPVSVGVMPVVSSR